MPVGLVPAKLKNIQATAPLDKTHTRYTPVVALLGVPNLESDRCGDCCGLRNAPPGLAGKGSHFPCGRRGEITRRPLSSILVVYTDRSGHLGRKKVAEEDPFFYHTRKLDRLGGLNKILLSG